ncbi:hypothetical protein HY78_00910 [Rhizorhabdus wittichii DC-6]|nr:hypothetical protein HY78_00910 [Rhizorhabdus wittichii DC-6]
MQEYLGINGIKLKVDGDWGPATARGLATFAPGATIVDQAIMTLLARPIVEAVQTNGARKTLAETVVAVAQQHLAQHPIEVGGQNAGPWVREYMDGNEGNAWPWCAGFVTYVVRQALDAWKSPAPFAHLKRTYSCDILADRARLAAKFVPATSDQLAPGSIFLVRGAKPNDWVHTGIVIAADAKTITTIEGNTNDEGSREGYEVCRRIRNRANLDAVLL